MPIIPRTAHLVNEIDGRLLTVCTDVYHSYKWVDNEPVFTNTDVVEIQSVNHENGHQAIRVVLPMNEAISMAKAILAAYEDEAMDAHVEEMFLNRLAA